MYLFGMFSSPSLNAESLIATQAPIAWPIAKLLDWILGANETHTYRKAELKYVVLTYCLSKLLHLIII